MFRIFSLYFLQVFFQFSPTFPNDKTELFPSSSVDGCLQEHWDWQDFLLQGMLPVQKFINRLHDFCVNRSCTCCGNIFWHLVCLCVCACVRMNFSAIYRLVPCLKAKTGRNATTRPVPLNDTPQFMQKQRVRRWDGASFSCSSKASNSSTQTCAAHWNTAKHEANNRLYKIWPLWQQKAIAIWPSASEHGYSIHEAKRHSLDFTLRRALWSTAFQRSLFILLVPTAILQREGFWQHKGLGKNINTYYDFGCECHPDLQRLGNTKRARLLEVDIYLGCFNWRQRRIDCLMSITLLSPQTPLMRMLSDHTRIPPQTMNSSHMLLTRKLCWLIVMTLSNEKNGEIVRQNAPSSTHRCQ